MVSITDAIACLRRGEMLTYPARRGVISLKGKDILGFLQGMATNDLRELPSTKSLETSFTNNKGRMIDHCSIFMPDRETVLIVSSLEIPQPTATWLEQHHFAEDLVIEPLAPDTRFNIHLTTADKKFSGLSSRCWTASIPSIGIVNFVGILDEKSDAPLIIEEVWQTLRIMALFPLSPQEINNEVMPQNINLSPFISEAKGCYIGQEVIAKARTYQKNVKTLCGARLSEEAFGQIITKTPLWDQEGHWGIVTSVAPLYVANEINALVLSDLKDLQGKITKDEKATSCLGSFIIKNTQKSY
jgi:folate-binding protein YgfZ